MEPTLAAARRPGLRAPGGVSASGRPPVRGPGGAFPGVRPQLGQEVRCGLLAAAGLLLALSAAAAEVRTFVLGGSEHPWEEGGDGTDPVILAGSRFSPTLDTTNTPGNGIEFAARRGWISPTFFDGSRNIAGLVLEGKGSITAPNSSTSATVLRRAQLEGTVNGDHEVAFERKPVPFNPVVPAFGIWIILDFGQRVGVERIRFYPRNTVVASPDHPFHNDFLRGYEVWLNEQLTSTIKGVPDRLAVREHDNEEPVVDVPLTPQYVRLIKLRSLTELPFEVDEIEVYGTGYLPHGTYLSDLIDLGSPATIGSIRWREQVLGEELFSNLTVGMRSGLDDTPILFLQRIQEFMSVRIVEVTAEEYWGLPRSEQVTLQEDLENWSPWKTVENRGLNPAPAPRRFVRFRMEFAGGLFDTRLLERLEFDYLQPPIADTLRAEVFPRLARAEEPATFRYAVLLRGRGDIHGYDRLEIDSNAPVEGIRNVQVDGVPVEFEIESSTRDGFRISLPRIDRDGSVLELTFDIPIFRFGTTFTGRVFDSRFPTVPQRLEPGNAVDFGPGDIDELSHLTVEIPKEQIGRLVGEIVLDSRVVTPNGDGANDELRVRFNLLQVVRSVPVSLDLYDLSGRSIASLQAERDLGPASFTWDGRTAGGRRALPGTYVWVLRVAADAFEETHSGVLAVAW